MAEPSVSTLLADATAVLTAAGVASARWDAEQLLAHTVGCRRADLVTAAAPEPAAAERFEALVGRRAARVPLQHLVGSVGFRYLELEVGPGVFVPRPETELVAGLAVDAARSAGDGAVVVDLCSGSGAIALAVAQEVPAAEVHAVELDPAALGWLSRNADARRAAAGRPVLVHAGDVEHALPELDGTVHVVVANPPYLAADELADADPEVRDHDPHLALVAADDGLAVIRVVAATAARLLRPGGHLIVEHSDRQGETAPEVLRAAGFVDVVDGADLAGRPRVATGRRAGQA